MSSVLLKIHKSGFGKTERLASNTIQGKVGVLGDCSCLLDHNSLGSIWAFDFCVLGFTIQRLGELCVTGDTVALKVFLALQLKDPLLLTL